MSPPALETRGLSKSFGALTVANAIDFRLERGARRALIGPNGAGKTSFVNLVTGALQPSAGQILLDGEDVTALSQPARVKRGLARTFQITQLFRGLSVLENVTLAVWERRGVGGDPWRPAGRHRAAIEEAFALIERMGLGESCAATGRHPPLWSSKADRDRASAGAGAKGPVARRAGGRGSLG